MRRLALFCVTLPLVSPMCPVRPCLHGSLENRGIKLAKLAYGSGPINAMNMSVTQHHIDGLQQGFSFDDRAGNHNGSFLIK